MSFVGESGMGGNSTQMSLNEDDEVITIGAPTKGGWLFGENVRTKRYTLIS